MSNILRLIILLFLTGLYSSCQKIETHNSLSESQILYIKKMGLLDSNEVIQSFYSEHTKKIAGNFFTDKRMAKYWTDGRDSSKNEISSAFYSEIISIDTVFNAGLTYCPYMLVTKNDKTTFKVCVEGKKEEVKKFFEEAMKIWNTKKG